MTSTAWHRDGSGTPLLLLHGLTATWRIWAPVLPALDAVHDVFAPTLPGHAGGPPVPDGEVSIAAIADGVERILDEAGIGQTHIAGNSLGGWLSIELGRRGRALSVTALSPAGAWSRQRDPRQVAQSLLFGQWLFAHREQLGLDALMRRPRSRRALLRMTMEHGERVPVDAAMEMVVDMVECLALPGFAQWVRDSPGLSAADAQAYRVRVAWGEKDKTIPFKRFGVPMLAANEGAEHVTLPGCGHVPMYDDPALVARTILEVTSSVDAERAAPAAAG